MGLSDVVIISITLVNLVCMLIAAYFGYRGYKLKKEFNNKPKEKPVVIEPVVRPDGGIKIYTDTHDNTVVGYIQDNKIEYVLYTNKGNEIASFTMHNGTMMGGMRGFFNEHVLAAIHHRVTMLNEKVPCSQNRLALKGIEEALQYLEARTKVRQTSKE